MIDRRTLLAGAVGAAAFPGIGATQVMPRILRPAPLTRQIAPAEFPATGLWAFNGTFPGETLRARQGARMALRVENGLAEPTSVHWHGIRIANAMDGVPYLTQGPIPPGGTFDYAFDLPDAGTYWYHSHANSVRQMAMGLHGPLIVEEPEGAPEVDAEHTLVLDDIRLDGDAQVAAPFDAFHDRSHAGRIGNLVLTNGQMALTLRAAQHDRLRLRLINAANARIFRLGLSGMRGWIVALDGMPLETPVAIEEAFTLAPAQRADLIVDVVAEAGGAAHLVHLEQDGGYSQVAFEVAGQGAAQPQPAPGPLPPNPLPTLGAAELARALMLPLVMEGGAMGGMTEATWQGARLGPRDLAEAGMFWALNGEAGLPEVPMAEVARGTPVRIAMENRTAFPHAMHLHGMHFREVLAGGGFGPWRDTLLTWPEERREIALIADNPGDWLLHCHMLSHHAAGMGTWLRVGG